MSGAKIFRQRGVEPTALWSLLINVLAISSQQSLSSVISCFEDQTLYPFLGCGVMDVVVVKGGLEPTE
jgi:hypothetical protein